MEDIKESQNETKGPECQGECKKACQDKDEFSKENRCDNESWNWSKIKDAIMCWNECGKSSDQNMYNIISLFCIAIIASCVVFISFSVMNISQNMESLVNLQKYENSPL